MTLPRQALLARWSRTSHSPRVVEPVQPGPPALFRAVVRRTSQSRGWVLQVMLDGSGSVECRSTSYALLQVASAAYDRVAKNEAFLMVRFCRLLVSSWT